MTDNTLILPCRFAPEPAYYRMMALHPGPVSICAGERFNKRCKEAHRTRVADVRGEMEITVPIQKPYGCTWADTRVSLHGRWWEIAVNALESAYGRTPYFEFYADDFVPLLSDPERFTTVAELNLQFDRAIRRAIGLNIQPNIAPEGSIPAEIKPFASSPYWQVRADKLGFIPNLSILDMIFNLGPETLIAITR